MSVNNTTKLSYYYPCTTFQDFDPAAEINIVGVGEVVRGVEYPHTSQIDDGLTIFKKIRTAITRCLGYSIWGQTTQLLGRYQTLLESTLHIMKRDQLPPLLIAMQNHDLAVEAFKEKGLTDEAVGNLWRCRYLTGGLEKSYDFATLGFSVFTIGISDTVLEAIQNLKYSLQRNLVDDPAEKQKCLDKIEEAETALSSVCLKLSNVLLFFEKAKIHCKRLYNGSSGLPQRVRQLQANSQLNAAYHGRIDQRMQILSRLEPKKTMADVFGSMRTGQGQPPLKVENLAEWLTTMRNAPIEEEFRISYIHWLTLAWLTQFVIGTLEDELEQVKAYNLTVSKLQSDPLHISLQHPPLDKRQNP